MKTMTLLTIIAGLLCAAALTGCSTSGEAPAAEQPGGLAGRPGQF